MISYPEFVAEANKELSVTLPAWVWRRVLYSVEVHAESRRAAGYDAIGENYAKTGARLASALGVGSSGDLPVGKSVYDNGR